MSDRLLHVSLEQLTFSYLQLITLLKGSILIKHLPDLLRVSPPSPAHENGIRGLCHTVTIPCVQWEGQSSKTRMLKSQKKGHWRLDRQTQNKEAILTATELRHSQASTRSLCNSSLYGPSPLTPQLGLWLLWLQEVWGKEWYPGKLSPKSLLRVSSS